MDIFSGFYVFTYYLTSLVIPVAILIFAILTYSNSVKTKKMNQEILKKLEEKKGEG